MTITKAPVTGGLDLPDGLLPAGTVLVWRLTVPDSEGDTAIPAAPFSVTLDADGLMPASWSVWRNTRGVAGSAYVVDALVSETGPTGAQVRRQRRLGVWQVGEAASYTLGALQATAVPDAPGFYPVADIPVKVVSGTTYTVLVADKGYAVETSNAAEVAITLPADAPVGFSCIVTGKVQFLAAPGASLRQESGLSKLYARWSSASLRVASNVGGTAAVWQLDGSFTA